MGADHKHIIFLQPWLLYFIWCLGCNIAMYYVVIQLQMLKIFARVSAI